MGMWLETTAPPACPRRHLRVQRWGVGWWGTAGRDECGPYPGHDSSMGGLRGPEGGRDEDGPGRREAAGLGKRGTDGLVDVVEGQEIATCPFDGVIGDVVTDSVQLLLGTDDRVPVFLLPLKLRIALDTHLTTGGGFEGPDHLP